MQFLFAVRQPIIHMSILPKHSITYSKLPSFLIPQYVRYLLFESQIKI